MLAWLQQRSLRKLTCASRLWDRSCCSWCRALRLEASSRRPALAAGCKLLIEPSEHRSLPVSSKFQLVAVLLLAKIDSPKYLLSRNSCCPSRMSFRPSYRTSYCPTKESPSSKRSPPHPQLSIEVSLLITASCEMLFMSFLCQQRQVQGLDALSELSTVLLSPVSISSSAMLIASADSSMHLRFPGFSRVVLVLET